MPARCMFSKAQAMWHRYRTLPTSEELPTAIDPMFECWSLLIHYLSSAGVESNFLGNVFFPSVSSVDNKHFNYSITRWPKEYSSIH